MGPLFQLLPELSIRERGQATKLAFNDSKNFSGIVVAATVSTHADFHLRTTRPNSHWKRAPCHGIDLLQGGKKMLGRVQQTDEGRKRRYRGEDLFQVCLM